MIPIKQVKLNKIGNSFFIRVPIQYVNNGALNLTEEYDINVFKQPTLRKIKEGKKKLV